jgi:hypothetical protein
MLTTVFSFVCDRDTSDRPSQVTNPVGTLLLGYLNSDGSGGENLDVGQLILVGTRVLFSLIIPCDTSLSLYLDNPLAQNFQLDAGSVTVTVPTVAPKDSYIVVRAYHACVYVCPFARRLLYRH